MTAITGGTVRFKPNVHRLLGLQNRCPTSWGFKESVSQWRRIWESREIGDGNSRNADT